MSISVVMASLKAAWSCSSALGHCSRLASRARRGRGGVDAVADRHEHLPVELVGHVGLEGVEADDVRALAGAEDLAVERAACTVRRRRRSPANDTARCRPGRARAPRPGRRPTAMPSPWTSAMRALGDLEVDEVVDDGGVDGQDARRCRSSMLDGRGPQRGQRLDLGQRREVALDGGAEATVAPRTGVDHVVGSHRAVDGLGGGGLGRGGQDGDEADEGDTDHQGRGGGRGPPRVARAFSRARWPVAPDSLGRGSRGRRMAGRAITGPRTNTPMMSSSAPRPSSSGRPVAGPAMPAAKAATPAPVMREAEHRAA